MLGAQRTKLATADNFQYKRGIQLFSKRKKQPLVSSLVFLERHEPHCSIFSAPHPLQPPQYRQPNETEQNLDATCIVNTRPEKDDFIMALDGLRPS